MAENKSAISIVSLIVSLIILVLVIYIMIVQSDSGGTYDISTEKNLAGELSDNNLYHAAVEKYEKILSTEGLDIETQANINYLIGKIYFENLYDYENAAAHYIIARSLNPQGSFYAEAGKNLIASMEKMGRLLDAKRELDKTVNIDSIYAEHEGETVVAKIGERPIFLSEIENEIQKLPGEAQLQFAGKAGKRAFLNQYIGFELMHQAAVREGYDADPEILRKQDEFAKQLLIEKYVYEKVLPEVNIDTSDIRNYYLANKGQKYGDKEYEEVKNQVFMDYQQEKAKQAFSEYVARLSAVSNVQIFDENIE